VPKHTWTEVVRIGAHEVQLTVSGTRLVPTATIGGCSCSSSSSSVKKKR
jgi:hypothetical protein